MKTPQHVKSILIIKNIFLNNTSNILPHSLAFKSDFYHSPLHTQRPLPEGNKKVSPSFLSTYQTFFPLCLCHCCATLWERESDFFYSIVSRVLLTFLLLLLSSWRKLKQIAKEERRRNRSNLLFFCLSSLDIKALFCVPVSWHGHTQCTKGYFPPFWKLLFDGNSCMANVSVVCTSRVQHIIREVV